MVMQFKDTEGAPLPEDDDRKGWDLTLWGDFEMSMNVPLCIDLGENYYANNGSHVFTVSLRDILQEYLENHVDLDGGKHLQRLADLLREYAEKYEGQIKPAADPRSDPRSVGTPCRR